MSWLLFTEPPVPSKEKRMEQESMQTTAQTRNADDDEVQSDPGQSTKPTVGMFHKIIYMPTNRFYCNRHQMP